MKTIVLCGGMGTRLREEPEYKPKPMVEIGGKPIIEQEHHKFITLPLHADLKNEEVGYVIDNIRSF